MASKGILYIIISGVNEYKRAAEALRMAEYQAGDGRNIALMLQGEGVEWLEEGNENFRKVMASQTFSLAPAYDHDLRFVSDPFNNKSHSSFHPTPTNFSYK